MLKMIGMPLIIAMIMIILMIWDLNHHHHPNDYDDDQPEALCQANPPLLKLLCTLGHILPVENTLGSNFPVMVNFFRAEPTLSVVKDSGQSISLDSKHIASTPRESTDGG